MTQHIYPTPVVTIPITQQHLDLGTPHDGLNCALALALKHATVPGLTFPCPYVSHDYVSFIHTFADGATKRVYLHCNPKAKAFIAAFDQTNVRPGILTLNFAAMHAFFEENQPPP